MIRIRVRAICGSRRRERLTGFLVRGKTRRVASTARTAVALD